MFLTVPRGPASVTLPAHLYMRTATGIGAHPDMTGSRTSVTLRVVAPSASEQETTVEFRLDPTATYDTEHAPATPVPGSTPRDHSGTTSARWVLPYAPVWRGLYQQHTVPVLRGEGAGEQCSLQPFLHAGIPAVALLLPTTTAGPVAECLRLDVAWQALQRALRLLHTMAADGFTDPY